jgi:hypothetical protein
VTSGNVGSSASVGDMTAALRARWDPAAQPAMQPTAPFPLQAPVQTLLGTPAQGEPVALGAEALAPSTVQVQKSIQSEDVEDAEALVSSAEALVPRSQWEPLAVVPAAALVPTLAMQAAPASVTQGPAADRFEVMQIVQQVTRTLAWRDLDALQSGREVVLHLDDALLPQTVLTFRPAVAAPGAVADGLGAEVVVSLQTQSAEVRDFLETHGQAMVEAMARQAPGLRWAPAPELAWQGAAASGGAPGQGAERDDDGSSSSGRGQGSSGQQERDPSQGQPSGQNQGAFQGALNGAGDRANADAATHWAGQSEAARGQAAAAFTDAVDAAAAKPSA